ncbi:unnamed protein product, partial [Coregonus sp. 'balchen']
QIFQNIRQEYSRYQRRRQLEGAFNQSEAACSSTDAPSSSLTAPSSPPGASRKDQPSFTLRQVSYLCERLLKDHEEKIREEYEQILNTKLAGTDSTWHITILKLKSKWLFTLLSQAETS